MTAEPPLEPTSRGKRPRRADARGGRGRREVPPWVQGWTAVIGVAIAAIGLGFTAIQVFGLAGRPPEPTPIIVKPEAYIEEMSVGPDGISAIGRFRYVDLGAEKVYVLGRPANAPSEIRYLPAVEARVQAAASAATDARVDGSWEATIPVTADERMSWWAVVVNAGMGVGGGLEDLRVHGPGSSRVVAASEPFETGE